MKKLTSAVFLLLVSITGCAYDMSAVHRDPSDDFKLIDDLEMLEPANGLELAPANSTTCTPGAFAGCTSDGDAAYCGDDGRSLVVELCRDSCTEEGCID